MKKLNKKNYNTTDLDPEKSFERHVFHRDQFAHYLRWTHILKNAKIGQTIVDFGCGNGNLLEVLYRNKFKQAKYIGIDIRNSIKPDLAKLDWCEFYQEDLVNPQNETNFKSFNADHVVSFEVMEHVGKQNAKKFLENFKQCGHNNATFYLSTPNYDEKVGAAGNHTYDSGDGRGIDVQEHTHQEIHNHIINAGFTIVKKYGTFASIKDYRPYMNEWQTKMFEYLKDYYDSNLLSNIMAPFFPEKSRNTLWILKK
jgi:cyclopropane fatty-acyl-phospholipid synthase-like methyltransferase